MNPHWLKTIADYYQQHNPYLISAPVMFVAKNLYDKIQSLEFMSLIGIGAATIKALYPLMCNAANLAFKKEIYFEVGRTDTSEEPFSGDDTFLMFAIHKKYPDKIAFIKSNDSLVYTNAQSSLKEFFNQRKRWASKIKSYSQYYVQLTGALVFLFHASILFAGIASIFYKIFLGVLIIQVAVKFTIDFIFTYQVAGFFKKRNLLWLFLPVEILHLFYIIIISLFSARTTYNWKERKISN
jgi:cellulose synthase/poly-beta-1,6-N-acetylglucosamine synthase-like glycosyltransferase